MATSPRCPERWQQQRRQKNEATQQHHRPTQTDSEEPLHSHGKNTAKQPVPWERSERVNGTAATTTAALEAALERRAEIVLHPSYQLRWPECERRDIRVALAIRVDVLDTYVFEERTDLIGHPCVQCLDVWETHERQKLRRTRIVNIYNRARAEGGGYIMNRIDLGRLILGRTILVGDFNARSPL